MMLGCDEASRQGLIVSNVENTPAESGSDSFTLHEGTNVRIIDKTMKDWRHIELPDGRDGWLRENQIEEI